MYMNACPNKAAVREHVANYLKDRGIPCDNKLKNGKVKSFSTSKKNPVFQMKLESDLMFPVPKIFYDLCRFILEHAEQEGIFRKAGSKSKQDSMKKKIAKKKPWKGEGEDVDVIDAAALLKYYIRELSVPLIPIPYHKLFLACCDLSNKEELIVLATLLLPIEHLNLLSYLMIFFNQVASFSRNNKMNSYNLSVCVAPNILPVSEFSAEISVKTNEIVKILIENAGEIGVIPLQIEKQLNSDEINNQSNQWKLKLYFINFKRKIISLFC